MGYIDRFIGGKKKQEPESQPTTESTPSPSPPSSSDAIRDAPLSSSFGPPSISPSSLHGSAPFGSVMNGAGPSSSRLYDPYEGIAQSVGGKKTLYRLPERPEFLFEEEHSIKRRGWNESISFYTGLGYIAGGGAGVVAGAYRFMTVPPEFQGPDTMKLKTNRMLNSVAMYSRPLANSSGILGLYFSCFDSFFYNQLDQGGYPESLSAVLAGSMTGAMFRSPRGPRQAAAAALVGAVGGAGIVMARKVFPGL